MSENETAWVAIKNRPLRYTIDDGKTRHTRPLYPTPRMFVPTHQTQRMFGAVPLVWICKSDPLSIRSCNPQSDPADVRTVGPSRPRGCPDSADVLPDPADVRLRVAGLDLQSRPIEYKDFQSARQQCTEPKLRLRQ